MFWEDMKSVFRFLGTIFIIATLATLIASCFTSSAQAETLAKDQYLEESHYVEMDPELVKELQRALNDKLDFIKRHAPDYYVNIEKLKPLKVDGQLGAGTMTMLKLFQYAAGLTVDGVCGPATWKKLGKDCTERIRFAPDLLEEFGKSTSGYGFIQTLDTNRFYVFKKDKDGWLLTDTWKSATGNQKKGYITPSGSFTLSNKSSRNHSSIGKENSWKGNDATGFYPSDALGSFYIHSTLEYWEEVKKGVYQWVPEEPKKVLGKSITHGCIRLAPENAKWVTKHRAGTILIVLDKDPF